MASTFGTTFSQERKWMTLELGRVSSSHSLISLLSPLDFIYTFIIIHTILYGRKHVILFPPECRFSSMANAPRHSMLCSLQPLAPNSLTAFVSRTWNLPKPQCQYRLHCRPSWTTRGTMTTSPFSRAHGTAWSMASRSDSPMR